MKKYFISLFILALFLAIFILFPSKTKEALIIPPSTISIPPQTISISPKTILPGDPILITINSTSTPTKILFDEQEIPIFKYNKKSQALVGIDLNEKDLNHEVFIAFSNGEKISQKVTLTAREKIERPLGIPEKLGGNTPAAQKALVNNLTKENFDLNNIKSMNTQLWTDKFIGPLSTLTVTDDYGYSRQTGQYDIAHKGTDFRAKEGTEVIAMNDGIVRLARIFTIYGNTIAIDHGLGVVTLYMHLSKLNVKEGDQIKKGQIIGLSGKTGYAESSHLHISVKIGGISIDPIKFLEFF